MLSLNEGGFVPYYTATIRRAIILLHYGFIWISHGNQLFLQVWIWQMDGHDLYFEKGMPIRFKVQALKFHAAPTMLEQQSEREADMPVLGTAENPYIPLEVIAKADGDGLGMVHWFAIEGDDLGE